MRNALFAVVCPDWLSALDARFLLAVNRAFEGAWLAAAVDFLADDAVLVTLVLALAVWAWRKRGPEGAAARRTLLALLVTLVAVNLANTWVLKPLFGRPRPWDAVAGLKVMVHYRARSASFPSTHSLMAASAATLLALRLPALGALAWPVAAGVMFFCVQSGGHYPLDVAAGLALGLCAGLAVHRMLKRWDRPRAQTRVWHPAALFERDES